MRVVKRVVSEEEMRIAGGEASASPHRGGKAGDKPRVPTARFRTAARLLSRRGVTALRTEVWRGGMLRTVDSKRERRSERRSRESMSSSEEATAWMEEEGKRRSSWTRRGRTLSSWAMTLGASLVQAVLARPDPGEISATTVLRPAGKSELRVDGRRETSHLDWRCRARLRPCWQ